MDPSIKGKWIKGPVIKNLTKKQQMKLRIQFNNKAALKAAETYLINQNAPFRNSTIACGALPATSANIEIFSAMALSVGIEF